MSRRAWPLAVVIAVIGYGADVVTKQWALAALDPNNPVDVVTGLLRLQLIFNPGAAFSMGENFTAILSLVSTAAFIFVVGWMLPRLRHRGWAVASGLLLAGIVGNLTDRLIRPPGFLRGHVVDFLHLKNFAIFNVADIWITAAAVVMVWLVMWGKVGLDGRPIEDEVGSDTVTKADQS